MSVTSDVKKMIRLLKSDRAYGPYQLTFFDQRTGRVKTITAVKNKTTKRKRAAK